MSENYYCLGCRYEHYFSKATSYKCYLAVIEQLRWGLKWIAKYSIEETLTEMAEQTLAGEFDIDEEDLADLEDDD